jgi:uncharacterized protein Yka (UPF0111/DUF47 family)
MTSFIKKFILPKEVDFISALLEHSLVIDSIVNALYLCFIDAKEERCQDILTNEHQAQSIKEKNMGELLNTFITPIDRESIYRVITQLDWIAVSIRHFVLEAKAYKICSLDDGYTEIIGCIQQQSKSLNLGFQNLKGSDAVTVAKNTQDVRDGYEALIEIHIAKMAELADSNDIREMFIQKELLSQLKEISKRMQVCANSLEDIVVKMS